VVVVRQALVAGLVSVLLAATGLTLAGLVPPHGDSRPLCHISEAEGYCLP
jgi:hypothetical protein